MKISRDWLQTYFEKPLPKAEELARGLTMHAFEIEEIIKTDDDAILDVKVLPNRAHDCLCHYGLAKEVSAIFEMPLQKKLLEGDVRKLPESNEFSVKIESKKVKRFKAVSIHGVKVEESPEWLKRRIEIMGGKSINNIVDITNFVMFELGQPLHAFDADKLAKNDGWSFIVRQSKEGEKVTTLDGVQRTLSEGALLITDGETDGETILGIAGIKGGTETEITEKTKNIILEAATFDAPTIRKHAKLLNIRTEASIRFEKDLAPELPTYAIDYAVKLIEELAKGENFQVEGEADYFLKKRNPYQIGISVTEANAILGTSLTEKEIENILRRLQFSYKLIKDPVSEVINNASQYLDVPYVLGASVTGDAPQAFDCSSFTCFLYMHAGLIIPRMSIDQYVFGEVVSQENMAAGDLIFSNTGEGKIHKESIEYMTGTQVSEGIDHVGLYMGNGEVIHATELFGKVVREKLTESLRFKNIIGIRRISNDNDPRIVIEIPFTRLDMRLKEDLIEEIGRIYGLEHITSCLPTNLTIVAEIETEFNKSQKIREILVARGFSEVYTYSLVSGGEVEIENPIASNKKFLRSNLKDGVLDSIAFNSSLLPLLGTKDLKIFEIGRVFAKNKESTSVCIGVLSKGKDEIEEYTLEEAVNKFKQPEISDSGKDNVESKKITYQSISVYPFALRDIAIFVPSNVSTNEVEKAIKDNAGEYLVRCDLFDEFKKEDKTSYAYHLVFQSNERTLIENELNEAMDKVTSEINKNNWQVR